jgi:hypothetical protein
MLLVVVAGCGGGGGSTGSESDATTTTASAAPPASADGGTGAGGTTSSEAPADTDPPDGGEPAGAGGTATDVCGLVSGEELAAILGTAVKTQVFAGPPDTCDVQSTDGAPLAAFVLTNIGGVSASAVYDAFAGSPTAEAISGIGEKAAYDPSQAALVTIKNGAVLTIAVFDDGSGSTDEATRLDQMKRIAIAATGRM